MFNEAPEVHLPRFDGPLALLLDLIERRRLDVTEISLAAVADQFLEAVRALPSPAPDLLSEFLSIAGRLLVIKSRALLPRLSTEVSEDDPVVDLEARLAEYRLVRAAAERLQWIEQLDLPSHPGGVRKLAEGPAELAAVTPAQLWSSMAQMLGRKPTPDVAEPVASDERTTAASRARMVLERVALERRVAWSEIAGADRDTIVATFLAVLELFKRDLLRLEQDLPFGGLWLLEPLNGITVSLDRHAVERESQQA